MFSREPSHFWFELNTAKVTVNFQSFTDAHIYRSPDGQMLINLKQYGNEEFYLIKPDKQFIGSPHPANFREFPGFVYCRYKLPEAAPAGKFLVDPRLRIQDQVIEFWSQEETLTTITW